MVHGCSCPKHCYTHRLRLRARLNNTLVRRACFIRAVCGIANARHGWAVGLCLAPDIPSRIQARHRGDLSSVASQSRQQGAVGAGMMRASGVHPAHHGHRNARLPGPRRSPRMRRLRSIHEEVRRSQTARESAAIVPRGYRATADGQEHRGILGHGPIGTQALASCGTTMGCRHAACRVAGLRSLRVAYRTIHRLCPRPDLLWWCQQSHRSHDERWVCRGLHQSRHRYASNRHLQCCGRRDYARRASSRYGSSAQARVKLD
jgi:hypothetical protein